MKRLLLILLLAMTPVMAACPPPTGIVTQPGKIAFQADTVLIRVGELQAAAIQANSATPKGLDDATTKTVVEFSMSAAKVLKAAPLGWQQTVIALWNEAAPKIKTTNPTIQLAITALTGVLGAL